MKRKRWWIIGAVLFALLASAGAWAWVNRLPDDAMLERMLVDCWVEVTNGRAGTWAMYLRSDGYIPPMRFLEKEGTFYDPPIISGVAGPCCAWSVKSGYLLHHHAKDDPGKRVKRITMDGPDTLLLHPVLRINTSSIAAARWSIESYFKTPVEVYRRRLKTETIYEGPYPGRHPKGYPYRSIEPLPENAHKIIVKSKDES